MIFDHGNSFQWEITNCTRSNFELKLLDIISRVYFSSVMDAIEFSTYLVIDALQQNTW